MGKGLGCCAGEGLCIEPPPPHIANKPKYKEKVLEVMEIIWIAEAGALLLIVGLILMLAAQPWTSIDKIQWNIAYISFILLGIGNVMYVGAVYLAYSRRSQTGIPVWKQIIPLAARDFTVKHIQKEFVILSPTTQHAYQLGASIGMPAYERQQVHRHQQLEQQQQKQQRQRSVFVRSSSQFGLPGQAALSDSPPPVPPPTGQSRIQQPQSEQPPTGQLIFHKPKPEHLPTGQSGFQQPQAEQSTLPPSTGQSRLQQPQSEQSTMPPPTAQSNFHQPQPEPPPTMLPTTAQSNFQRPQSGQSTMRPQTGQSRLKQSHLENLPMLPPAGQPMFQQPQSRHLAVLPLAGKPRFQPLSVLPPLGQSNAQQPQAEHAPVPPPTEQSRFQQPQSEPPPTGQSRFQQPQSEQSGVQPLSEIDM